MNSPDSPDSPGIGATITAEAEARRRSDRTLAQLESDIRQAWADIAPTKAVVHHEGPLLDQAANLAALDPHVPVGSRRGLHGAKWLIRKLTYWYVRFLTDQFNVFAGVLVRHLRHQEDRLGRLEAAAGAIGPPTARVGPALVGDPPEPSPAVINQVALMVGPGPCLVVSGGEGGIVEAVGQRGIPVYGVEQDPDRVLAGLRRRLDIRTDDLQAHLAGLEDEEIGTIVLTGVVEALALPTILDVLHHAGRALTKTGRVVVAVADPAGRDRVAAELGAGLGISPVTWHYLLEQADFDALREPCSDSRITEIVLAQRSQMTPEPGSAAPQAGREGGRP
ncbi:hypothetical protein [Candidatus Poriferisocius sp.]|uniref:hypothetical protein n=1 Tax=Candidatus Poriferisocius sp. TaxID=3101276 RepID=UPI003B58B4EF